jgi:BirA family biotin operon repressor/biotin-[acetyl-CoA-carboxylase] ligase
LPVVLPNPTSLYLHCEEKFEIDKILFQLYARLERQYLRLQAGRFEEILLDYKNRLFRINTKSKYKLNENSEIIDGIIEGVDETGRLLVRINDSLKSFDLKQISPVF